MLFNFKDNYSKKELITHATTLHSNSEKTLKTKQELLYEARNIP